MAYSYDNFVAVLKCPVCGNVTSLDDPIEMHTYIRDHPNAEDLGVGSPLPIETRDFEQNTYDGYLKVNPPAGDEVRLLNPWNCPACGSYNWAEIVVRGGVIESITAAPLNRETLERSHLISNEADFEAAALAGVPVEESARVDAVRILRAKLP